MPRVVKYDDQTTPSGSLRKGNMVIGPGNFDYGTSFYTAVEPPLGGYTIYLNKATGGPSIYTADSESELISITKEVSGTTYANTEECLNYYAGQSDKVVISSTDNIPTSVIDGLVLNLNAQSGFSYPTTGSTWYDLNGNNNGTLTNGPVFSDGIITFDGTNDRIDCGFFDNSQVSNSITLCLWIKLPSWQSYGLLAGNGGGWGSYGFNLFMYQTNKIRFELAGNGNRAVDFTGVDFNNKWNFITATWESGSNMKSYVNSIAKEQTTGITEIQTNSGTRNLQLSGYSGGPMGVTYMSSSISSFQVYNRALTPQEIKQNYFQAPIVTDGLVFNVDPSNLVSYENGSSNVYSLTGSISGSLLNGVGYSRNYGSYLNFDGSNDWIQFEPDFLTSSGLTGGTPKTMEVWMTCEFTGNNFKFMFAIGSPSQRNAFFIGRQFGSNLDFGAYGDDMVVGGFFADKIGVPVHLVLTYESGVARGYYNGDQIISANKSWSLGSSVVRLGRQVNSFGEYFAGKLFSARLYNKALSPDEIRQNFDAQRNRFGL